MIKYNTDFVARDTLTRYAYCRDRGHIHFMEKARRCEDFFLGDQWDPADVEKLRLSRRPALTINKILPTVSHVVGEQLYNRAMIQFRPAKEGTQEVADALSMVFMNVSQENKLPWTRTDVFTDGIIMSRGFYDVRLDFNKSLMGEIKITRLNPMNVLLGPEDSGYDPSKWSDIITTNWHTLNEIELMYGKDKADALQRLPGGYTPYDFPADDLIWDSYGDNHLHNGWHYAVNGFDEQGVRRVRVVERQHKVLTMVTYLVNLVTGDMNPLPDTWEESRIAQYLQNNPDVTTIRKRGFKIRWDVVAADVVLHSDWSPYNCFTVVPYFPYLRSGRTSGVVEHLIGPQELLNKTRSQELHVINTSSNSGWITEEGNLVNVTLEELELRGAETGIVLSVNDLKAIDKIKPNQIPTGLDRVSYKSEEDIKNISGVSDYVTGNAREDVSGKAVRLNQSQSATGFGPILDNLNRSDTLMAEVILDMTQSFYTEPRILHITGNTSAKETNTVEINQKTPEGMIINDMTLGTYSVVVTYETERDNMDDSQFDHAVSLKKDVGVDIPDEYMIEVSKLRNKADILETMRGNMTPEKQAYQEKQERETADAELAKLKAEGADKMAEAQLKAARAAEVQLKVRQDEIKNQQDLSPEDLAKARLDAMGKQQDAVNDRDKANHEFMLRLREMRLQHEFNMKEKAAEPKPQAAPAAKPKTPQEKDKS